LTPTAVNGSNGLAQVLLTLPLLGKSPTGTGVIRLKLNAEYFPFEYSALCVSEEIWEWEES
jgi:hypothetical protein